MCEPFHSIVQYPTVDPVTTEPVVNIVKTAIEQAEVIDTPGVIIGNFINYSTLGKGHSEAIRRLPIHVRSRLPRDAKYEANWWNRSVKLDGLWPIFQDDSFYKNDSKESATEYANRSSIGDTKILRRFLEMSLLSTRSPQYYVTGLMSLFSYEGKQALELSLKRAFKYRSFALDLTLISLLSDPRSEKMTVGIILKTTRKRENLSTEWADDGKLWQPKEVIAINY